MGLQDATKVRLSRKEVKDTLSLHSRSIIKKEMEGKTKCDQIYNRDFGKIQDFMRQESLEIARMEVLLLTNTIDTRTTMKAKYNKNCPHCTICGEGIEEGTLESPFHLIDCQAYSDLSKV